MIRKATPLDIDAVAALYDEVLTDEANTGHYSNWQKGIYPTRTTAEKAIAAGTLYVLEENGVLCASVILNDIQNEVYEKIPWRYPADPHEVRVIHTLCVAPSQKGRGYAGEMLLFCREQARSEKSRVIRMDTYSGNEPAKRLYQKHGYRIAGQGHALLEGVIDEELTLLESLIDEKPTLPELQRK